MAQVAAFVRANPAVGILVTLGLLVALLLLLKAVSNRRHPHPELLRKLLHIGMGLVTLTFPWLYANPWPVVILAASATLLLTAVKAPGPLRKIMGGVADGVERHTYGDIYFPIGVATLFWLASRADPAVQKLLYCVPILLLTLGDSIAALVGVRFGRHKFTTAEGDKSAEGSLACFVVGFLCALGPLEQFTKLGHAEALLIALNFGLLATVLEAVAWGGLDNLFLPLGGFLLLKSYLALPLPALALHLAATVALFVFVFAWRTRTALNDSAALGAALYAYCAWSIGGALWLFAPALLFIGYPLVWPRTGQDAGRRHNISVVLCVGAAGLVWLVGAAAFQSREFVFGYSVAFAAQMAMIGLARLRNRYPETSGRLLLPLSVAGGWLLLIAPTLLIATPRAAMPVRAAAALAGVLLATLLFDRLRRDLKTYPCDAARWRLQAGLGLFGSAIGAVPLLWGS